MQIEDITRLRQSEQHNKQIAIEHEQQALLKQLNHLIKQQTVDATERSNDVLRQVIKLIKQN